MPITKGQLNKLAHLMETRKENHLPGFVLVLGSDASGVLGNILDSLTHGTKSLSTYDQAIAELGLEDQLATASAEIGQLKRPAVYSFVAALAAGGFVWSIITSNIDSFLEDSLRDIGIPYSKLRVLVVGEQRDELVSNEIGRVDDRVTVIKLRGDVSRNALSIVRADTLPATIAPSIENILKKDLIICGYDPRFDDSIIGAHLRSMPKAAIWFVGERRPTAQRGSLISASLEQRKSSYIVSKLPDFFRQILEGLTAVPATLAATPKIESYKQKVIEDLTGDWFDRFINLYMIPVKLQFETIRKTDETYNIIQIAERFGVTPIILIGEPGAGKTTLLKKLGIEFATKGTRLPVFLRLLKYRLTEEGGILTLIRNALHDFSDLEIINLLDQGQLLILLDGLNEVDREILPVAILDIQGFVDGHPLNQYFLSCRTAELPHYLRDPFERMEVLPADPQVVKDYLTNALGKTFAESLFSKLGEKVRSLCRNPLLLTMLVYIFEKQSKAAGQIPELGTIPASKAQLYQKFVDLLMEREGQLRHIETPISLRQRMLRLLAFSMNNQVLFRSRAEAESFLESMYNPTFGISTKTFLHEILDLPPLRASVPGQVTDISFMHQSFQEFYTALELLSQLEEETLTMSEIGEYAFEENKHWWETLTLLAGVLDNSTDLVKAVKGHSIYLASRCIESSKITDSSEVDNVIIQVVDAWKYGGEFNYPLLYCMQAIADRRSPYLPSRIMDNIEYLLRKYVRESPTELTDAAPDTLLAYLDAEDEGLQIDAIWTIGSKRIDAAASRLIRKLGSASARVKEQCVIALGRIGDSKAIDPLTRVMNDTAEPDWMRAYAANALGAIGNPDAIPALIAYMDDPAAPYRDSAAWAIERIKDPRAKDILIRALSRETDQWTLGTSLYALGELHASDAIDAMIAWLQDVKNPYVIEDGVYALGKLGGDHAIRELIRQLSNPDSIVRMRAANSLGWVGDKSSNEPLKALSSDPADFVRRSAASALDLVQSRLLESS